MTTPFCYKSYVPLIVFFCTVLVLFVWWQEQQTLSAFEQRTHQYGRYLEIPLWNLDTDAATQYLQLVAQSRDHRAVAIYHSDGNVFAASESEYAPGPLDRLLHSIHLIRDYRTTQPIRHDGRLLGHIEIVWINDNLYVHIATALFLAPLGKILHYNFQLRANSRTLARNNLALQQSEQRLRESEDHLQRITESLGEGLLITDPDDVVLYANTRLTEMTGFTREDLLGRPAYELLLPPEAHSRMRERNRERNRDISEQYEIEILDKNGQSFWAHIHATPFRNNTGEIVGTLGAMTDISERKQLETQLLHAQKVDTIGQLTAGIAHNFNNMLLGIMGNIEFAIMEGPEHIKPFLNESYRICEQVADMVSQLMAYSHRGVHTAHEPFDPTAIIARTISFCQSTFDRKISIETDCGDDLPTILGDAGQIEQSLLNLMLNARDALANLDGRMPSICLSADIVTLDGKAAALVADAEEGTFLRLQVSDNGAGMDETAHQWIFDPFFTTKSIGQGTGLGLSTVCTATGSHASARLARARPSHSIFHQPPTRRAKPRRRPRNPQQPVAKRCWLSTTKNRCAPSSRAASPLTAMRPCRPPMAAKASKSCSATTSI